MIWSSLAVAATCTQTTLAEVAAIPAPAVIVLGGVQGMSPDLPRAKRLVKKLPGPVTLAVQAVAADKQAVLDRFQKGELPIEYLEAELGWSGFPFKAYQGLLSLDVPLVALGVPVEPKPPSVPIPLPPGYARLLADGMSGHAMPVDLEGDFVQLVAWLDHRMALRAIENWDHQGYLVILVDRAHVEGGKGVGWQAQRMTEEPVHRVLLAGEGACYAGDQYL